MRLSLARTVLDALQASDDPKVNTKPWGREYEVSLPGEFQLKVIEVDNGECTSLQLHESKDEVLVIIEGTGHVAIHDRADYTQPCEIHTRDVDPKIRITPGTVHRAWGPVRMIEFSNYHPTDVVRLADDYDR